MTAPRCLLRDERGQSLLSQTLILLPLLLMMLGLVVDLGAVAIAQVKAQDVVDLAAYDAAKQIHVGQFSEQQEVVLTQAAVATAHQRLADYGGGRVALTQLTLFEPDGTHTALYMEGDVRVPTPFLRLVGIPTITRRVWTVAVPAFGIGSEGT